jgi:malonate-semialdehyde dehydrogenase (acetylating)/methylmalonate-semialdehyde dehydrogenase
MIPVYLAMQRGYAFLHWVHTQLNSKPNAEIFMQAYTDTADVGHYINGQRTPGKGQRTQAIYNPATGEVARTLRLANPDDVEQAVSTAVAAFPAWANTPAPRRARVMFKFLELMNAHCEELAAIITAEHGKVFSDAMGEVARGIDIIEFACGIPQLLKGDYTEQVATGLDNWTVRQPLGVVAGITPFNFPAMIPLWMFPMAIVCGNAFILKPSEQDPLTPMRLAELFEEAGAPKGILQVVHGGKEQVDVLLTDPAVKAVSFVGSVSVGQYIYETGTRHMKRVQSFAGAKNHMVIMPDADKEQVLNALVGSSVGAAGQRCMAISVAVFVGEAQQLIPELKEALAKVRPGAWNDKNASYGPIINVKAKERVEALIATGEAQGATLLLDGRGCTVEGLPDGNWVGPTLFSDVTTDMDIYNEEVFGPVLSCMNVDSLGDAIELINNSPYGNGTSIFTNSGGAARRFQHEIEVGNVGVNIPVPVPLPFFSFTGWKGSFYGDQHAYGKQAVRFYTETKTVTSRWFSSDVTAEANFSIHLR